MRFICVNTKKPNAYEQKTIDLIQERPGNYKNCLSVNNSSSFFWLSGKEYLTQVATYSFIDLLIGKQKN